MRAPALVLIACLALLVLPHRNLPAAELAIASGQGAESPRQPQVAISAAGVVHVVYGVGEQVCYSTSSDRGRTFSKPVSIGTCPNMSLGMRRGPRIALSGETAVVTAIGGPQGKGRDGDIRTWTQQPDGKWIAGAQVNDVESSAREGLHGMAAGPDGSVWCVWLDLRNRKSEVSAARSRDAGQHWDKNVLAYHSPDGSVCECCHPSVAIDDNNQLHILFRNSLKGARDMYVVSSKDGTSFGPAEPASKRSWMLKACPMDGGMLAIDRDGTAWSAYRREKQVFVAAEGRETLLGTGEQPVIALAKGKPLLLWTTARTGDLQLQSGRDGEPRTLARTARDPSIAASRAGDLATAVWEEVDGGAIRIRAAVVP